VTTIKTARKTTVLSFDDAITTSSPPHMEAYLLKRVDHSSLHASMRRISDLRFAGIGNWNALTMDCGCNFSPFHPLAQVPSAKLTYSNDLFAAAKTFVEHHPRQDVSNFPSPNCMHRQPQQQQSDFILGFNGNATTL